ncbi:aldolase [Rozella allomycis CSF55]|uniref:hydroxymethylglutaryl-CoA lyase n=1 Tax=Rozella allomycis (strain CSF55) TaxID=988480 RepID=A0A075AT10_ROZAC|nr:Aldolase-type TIM barrel domain-containing protein [Rozella allomycis CSF55]RKP19837.1 aldolase [Rozella allomycis CSF55]|eukprot:EPZ31628.1 Aldolase-type TIM barrel domain-containing protein [Rozella allomycis CSF55]
MILLALSRRFKSTASKFVKIVEVGPRDGLQNEKTLVSTANKVQLINLLSDTGLKYIETSSFVSPKRIPQWMADAADVFSQINQKPGITYAALVPNLKGLELAIKSNVKEIAVFASASEGFSQKNINCSIDESFERFEPVIKEATRNNIKTRGVFEVSNRLLDLGCYEVSLGDTIGIGHAGEIRSLLDYLKHRIPSDKLAVHFHNTYGQALANIYVAVEEYGIRVVDGSVGGLGGCPYALGATGNVPTEDVVYMLQGLGYDTGVNLDKLIVAGNFINSTLKRVNASSILVIILSKFSHLSVFSHFIMVVSTLPGVFSAEKLPKEDYRSPLFLGLWKRSVPYHDESFAVDHLDEPHIKRKRAILESHPEIKELYGPESKSKYIALAVVAIQISLAHVLGDMNSSWAVIALAAYIIGATLTQTVGTLVHEAAHDLFFETPVFNRFMGLFVNIPIVFPISHSFRRYHLEHHAYQGILKDLAIIGVDDKDPDLPMEFEYKLVKGNTLLKFIWLFFFPMMYVVRGAAMKRRPTFWELANLGFTLVSDLGITIINRKLVILQTCGVKGFTYLFLSLWFGYGIHPCAGHFIQEHYTFKDGQETYSYYGSFNYILMNIGYHNEHHDFTKIPWSKLPKIKEIAKEFYEPLCYHTSWWKVLYDFVTRRDIGPQSRLERSKEAHKHGRSLINSLKTNKTD